MLEEDNGHLMVISYLPRNNLSDRYLYETRINKKTYEISCGSQESAGGLLCIITGRKDIESEEER